MFVFVYLVSIVTHYPLIVAVVDVYGLVDVSFTHIVRL